MFTDQDCRGYYGDKRLRQLGLTDAGNATQRKTFVPPKKPSQLADQSEIEESHPYTEGHIEGVNWRVYQGWYSDEWQ